jgi:hypothetical protein
MAETTYTYSIQSDFPNHLVCSDRLTQEVGVSAIIVALSRIDTAAGNCLIVFKDALSSGDEDILDGLVAAHSGEAIIHPATVLLGSPETSDGKPIFLPCLFPGNVFLYPTGAGDNVTNQTRGDGQAFVVKCSAEQDYNVEFQFIDWVYLAGGGIKWKNGEEGDWVSLAIYAPATPVTPNGSGTGNCNLVDPGVGAAILIVPAAGNGAYDVDLEDAIPVPSYTENEEGIQTPNGFYNWSDPDTGSGVVTAGVPQASPYNLFAVALDLVRFANRLQLEGAEIQDLTVPAVKPKKILPQWKFKVTAHHAAGTADLVVHWWLTTARIKTT